MKGETRIVAREEYKPTPEEREAAARHVKYEIDMFCETLAILASLPPDGGSHRTIQVIHHALLESCVVHARNLIDFLFPRKQGESACATSEAPEAAPPTPNDDVVARHFCKWTRDRKNMPSALWKFKTWADKRVEHLTYARIKLQSETPEWPLHDVATEIIGAYNEWNQCAHSSGGDWPPGDPSPVIPFPPMPTDVATAAIHFDATSAPDAPRQ
jgi:hypothetical protein